MCLTFEKKSKVEFMAMNDLYYYWEGTQDLYIDIYIYIS